MNNDLILGTTPHDIDNRWCVYSIYHASPLQLFYIGCCRLRDVFMLPDARKNTSFRLYFSPDTKIIVRVNGSFNTRREALNGQKEAIKQNNYPLMNRVTKQTRNTAIRCVETGEEWPSAMKAVAAHGLSQSNLSNHLNGRQGYDTVKGRRYERILQNCK